MILTESHLIELPPIELYQALYRGYGCTQQQFADLMGINKRTFEFWIAGQRNPAPIAYRLSAELAEKYLSC